MKAKIDNNKVKIIGEAVDLLRLKSKLFNRLGRLVSSAKNEITIPLSSLYSVRDILSPICEIDGAMKDAIESFEIHAKAREKSLSIIETQTSPNLSGNWNNVLDPAQVTAVAAMTVMDLLGLCLFDEQGSGKTVMTIAAFDILKEREDIDSMIVVCPKSMVSEWKKDIEKFLDKKYQVIIAEGDKKRKAEISRKKFDVLIANYEGIEPMLVWLKARSEKTKFLLVVDESYHLKNERAVRSEYAMELRNKCKRCFVLCGTPAPNSAYDLVNQFNLADNGFTFGTFGKYSDLESDQNKITDLINEKGLYIRRLKSQILKSVPQKNFHILSVELSDTQKLVYEEARSNLEIELKRLDNKTFKKQLMNYFQKREFLMQICSCPNFIVSTLPKSAKYTVLDKLLLKLIGEGRKVIIWAYYTNSLNEIEERYSDYDPVRVDGSVGSEQRREAVERFQNDPDTMLFIGNPKAAGAGITLHTAYDAVYFSYSNQAASYLQSLDRIHRRGQSAKEVNYYLLICKGTIEESEVKRLREKELHQHNILGDHIKWPTSLDDALKELSHE